MSSSDSILSFFPAHTHPLILVSDPDGLLDVEARTALIERGFRLLDHADPVELRYAVQRAMPFTAAAPLVIVSTAPLNTLPYDLWQQGQHLTLELADFFPHLALGVVRSLSAAQRRRLHEALTHSGRPAQTLGVRETQAYVLEAAFGLPPARQRTPAQMLVWLDEHHVRAEPLPRALAQALLAQLRSTPALAKWPLAELLNDAAAFQTFVQQAWSAYVRRGIRERGDNEYAASLLPFDTDAELQNALPRLVRGGTLTPLPASDAALPAWAAPALRAAPDDRLVRFADELHAVQALLIPDLAWDEWQQVAWKWAQLSVWRYDPALRHAPEQQQHFARLCTRLDDQFLVWAQRNYAPLATRALPTPHHLHHVPQWLAYQRQQYAPQRPALLVLDGMALADWVLIRAAWAQRHPAWAFDEHLLLAQIPSITAISRQALLSGLRPSQFAATLTANRREKQQWTAFWQQHSIPPGGAAYASLPTTATATYPDAMSSRHTQALCLVSTVLDDMIHGATQGAADMQAALQVWLQPDEEQVQRARWLEGLIDQLLDFGYTVHLTSDHSHIEAHGIGQPQESVTAISRSKRARLYTAPELARVVQLQYPETTLWHDDGLLPSATYVLMPRGRGAFVSADTVVISHGGITLEELIVPLVTITRH